TDGRVGSRRFGLGLFRAGLRRRGWRRRLGRSTAAAAAADRRQEREQAGQRDHLFHGNRPFVRIRDAVTTRARPFARQSKTNVDQPGGLGFASSGGFGLTSSGGFDSGGVGAGFTGGGAGLVFGGVLELVQPSTAMPQPTTTAISLFIGLVLSLVPR